MRVEKISLGALATLCIAACSPDGTCLGGDDGECLPPSACAELVFACDDPLLEIRRIRDAAADRPAGLDALAAQGDVLLGNARVVMVLDALDAPHYLGPTGGTVLDLAPRGVVPAADNVNQILQIGGVLPEDAAAYHALEIVDEAPDLVAVIARGTLEGRPGVTIVTRYELRPCEPGVRIRSELYQGGREVMTVFLADGYYWGDRNVTPFVPLPEQGFVHPELDLLTIDDAFRPIPYMAAPSHAGSDAASAIATVPCNERILHGFQDPNVSAAGLEPAILVPGDGLAFERFLTVAPGPGLAGAIANAADARAALFGERFARVTGRAVGPGGVPIGGDESVASLLFVETTAERPLAEAVPAADGSFSVTLPVRRSLRVQPHVLGQPRGTPVTFETIDDDVALGDVTVPATGRVGVTVAGPDGLGLSYAEVVLTPRDPARRAELGGTVYGQFVEDRCAPYLGPPHGPSPACNRALLDAAGAASFSVPAGEYFVYATHGPFWTLARVEVDVAVDETTPVALALEPLPDLLPEGVVSADLHVHSGASADSSFPEMDRARSFVAADVRVIAATDHDVVTSYDAALDALGVRDRVVVLPGVETTGHILWMRPPGSEFPKVIGHYNFWPLVWDPARPRNGAPDDERLEPGALFDRVDALFDPVRGAGVRQLNHPFEETVFGRDEGYFTAIGWDPRDDIPLEPDDTSAGQLVRRPGGGAANLDHHVQEVLNGASQRQHQWYRAAWFGLLRQGIVRGGTSNSDSHSLATDVLGYPRNLVFGGHDVASFDVERFDEDVRHGHIVGTNGPVILATIVADDGTLHGPSIDPFRPAAGATLAIEVRAAPWIPVEEIRIVLDGEIVRVIDDLAEPTDPFGMDGLLRFDGEVALAELLDRVPADRDVFLVVEAGLPLWPAADLDDDGLVDTTDNDGDGDIDEDDDLDEDDEGDEGDFLGPPRASTEDPRFHLDVIAPGTWPASFTNPFLLDRGGAGWRVR